MEAKFGKEHLLNSGQISLSDRFILEVEGFDVALIESVTRPGYTIKTEAFDLMEYKFNFPQKLEFENTITVVLVEMLDPEINFTQMENVMSRIMNDSYYTTPSGLRDPKNPFLGQPKSVGGFFKSLIDQGSTNITLNLSKQTLTRYATMSTGAPVVIHTLDSDGQKYESMRLNGAMITAVKFSGLTYSTPTVNKITLTFTFDYVDFGRRGVYNYGGAYDKLRGLFPDVDTALKESFRKKVTTPAQQRLNSKTL